MVLVSFGALSAQKVEEEGNAWLARYSEPAEISVNGVWDSDDWGAVTLNQADDSRDLTGEGDGWIIKGVVSGKKIALLFTWKGRVEYSAELDADGEAKLVGSYSRRIMTEDSKKKDMLLTK
jgi:SH3-like domain-containing protein